MGDIHGNIEALQSCMAMDSSKDVDRVNVLGDIVGYMANPNECVDLVRSFECISGNHDIAVMDDSMLEDFNPYAGQALLWTREHLNKKALEFLKSLPFYRVYADQGYTIAHGSIIDPFMYIMTGSQAAASSAVSPTDLLFVAHTHVPAMWSISEDKDLSGKYLYNVQEMDIEFNTAMELKHGIRYVINIGSVGQPRDGNPKGCCVLYDTNNYSITYIRFKYPVEETIQKIIKNGLPSFLHRRLLKGI